MNKILLVDDDRELTSLLKELLEMEGFNVIVAHDGEQALDLLDEYKRYEYENGFAYARCGS